MSTPDDYPGFPPLRFSPGDRVECNVGTWAPGKVLRLWYQEQGMPEPAPYQIELDDGRFIFAPADVDECVRALSTPTPASPEAEDGLNGLRLVMDPNSPEPPAPPARQASRRTPRRDLQGSS